MNKQAIKMNYSISEIDEQVQNLAWCGICAMLGLANDAITGAHTNEN